MGWLGRIRHMEDMLVSAGADVDGEGRFLIYGEAPFMFDGSEDDVVVPDGTLFSLYGVKCSLAEFLTEHGCGVGNIRVGN